MNLGYLSGYKHIALYPIGSNYTYVNVVGVTWHMDDRLMVYIWCWRKYPMLGQLRKMVCPHMKWINANEKREFFEFVSIYISRVKLEVWQFPFASPFSVSKILTRKLMGDHTRRIIVLMRCKHINSIRFLS